MLDSESLGVVTEGSTTNVLVKDVPRLKTSGNQQRPKPNPDLQILKTNVINECNKVQQDSPVEEHKNTETKKSEILDISSFSGQTAVIDLPHSKAPVNVSQIEDVESDVD